MIWELSTFEINGRWGVRGVSAVRGVDFAIPAVCDTDAAAQAAGTAWVDRWETSLAATETAGTSFSIGEV